MTDENDRWVWYTMKDLRDRYPSAPIPAAVTLALRRLAAYKKRAGYARDVDLGSMDIDPEHEALRRDQRFVAWAARSRRV